MRLPVAGEASPIPSAVALVSQLQNLIGLGRKLNPSQCSAEATQKLICHSFTCLIEGSARDHTFWHVAKQQVQFSELMFSLLLDESRQSVRTSVRGTINAACNSSRLSKKQVKPLDTNAPETRSDSPMENP